MRHPNRLLALVLTSALAMVVAAPAAAQHGTGNLVEVAQEAGAFGTLLAAVEAAGLVETLQGRGPFTVFAPTDDAFAHLPDGTVEALLEPENRDRLRAILAYHVVPARVTAAEASGLQFAGTLNRQRVSLRAMNGGLRVGESSVIQADVMASNGIIHVIDRVLLPEEQSIAGVAAGAGTFSTLLAAAQAAGLAEALDTVGPFTVLAPTDDAFAALPDGALESLLRPENRDQLRAIIELHVFPARVYSDQALAAGSAQTLSGEALNFGLAASELQVNGVSIVAADLEASNGVIHVIDEVLVPQQRVANAGGPNALIRLAIDRGVPLFNRGDADACAAVYEVAMRALVDLTDLPQLTRADFERTLAQAGNMRDPVSRAWAYREAFDRALNVMVAAAE